MLRSRGKKRNVHQAIPFSIRKLRTCIKNTAVKSPNAGCPALFQSTCLFCISNCMHIIPKSPSAANQECRFAPLTPLLPQLSMHQSRSITTLHAVSPQWPPDYSRRIEEVLSSAGWPDLSASPRNESLAACTCTCTLLNGNHAAAMPCFSAQILCEDHIRLMTGNRHAVGGPLTRAPHSRRGSLVFSTIGCYPAPPKHFPSKQSVRLKEATTNSVRGSVVTHNRSLSQRTHSRAQPSNLFSS